MRRDAGTSLIELVVVMSIMGLTLGGFALYLTPMEGALEGGVVLTEGFLRQARAAAMATTSAYRVVPVGPGALIAQTAPSCLSKAWAHDPDMRLELPRDVEFTDTAWTICFSSRGMADANLILELQQPQRGTRQLEVLRGGTTRMLP